MAFLFSVKDEYNWGLPFTNTHQMSDSSTVPNTIKASPRIELLELLQNSLQTNQFIKLIFSRHTVPGSDIQRVIIKPVHIKNTPHLSFVYQHKTKDITKNFLEAEGLRLIETLASDFKNAYLETQEQEIQLDTHKRGEQKIHKKARQQITDASHTHNREKFRYLNIGQPFWKGLGITDTQHQLIPAMSRKWKQINKFIEVFDTAFRTQSQIANASKAISVVDFGSGKGYLTFAIYDYLQQLGFIPSVTGVELRDELTTLCNKVATINQMEHLQFYQGDIRSYQPDTLDVMIALHACDVATDYALHTGIRLNASIIMCAPCCHKQIRPQLQSPSVLRPLLQHGVHLGQEAEMLTDGLRALYLEACGYESKIFEFVALEHTSKNKMILAVKRDKQQPHTKQRIVENIKQLKAFYGIDIHCLEQLLQEDGLFPSA